MPKKSIFLVILSLLVIMVFALEASSKPTDDRAVVQVIVGSVDSIEPGYVVVDDMPFTLDEKVLIDGISKGDKVQLIIDMDSKKVLKIQKVVAKDNANSKITFPEKPKAK